MDLIQGLKIHFLKGPYFEVDFIRLNNWPDTHAKPIRNTSFGTVPNQQASHAWVSGGRRAK